MPKFKSSSSPSSSLLSAEDTHVVQRAVEAALAAVLQQQQPQNKPKNKTIKPLLPASTVERVATAPARATKSYKQSAKHGFRGVPPPLDFSLADLPPDQLLTEFECAALTRFSTSSFEAWRKRPGHPLQWTKIRGRVRYRAGDVRQFIASGYRPRRGRPKKDKGTAPPPRRRRARPRTNTDLAADEAP